MLSVEEAIDRILSGADTLGAETVQLTDIAGRTASEDIKALLTQPPFSASAMDGYAVRAEASSKGARLRVIGEAPAGVPFDGAVGAGEAVRVFTGAVVPKGADHVVIQEDVRLEGDEIVIEAPQTAPRNIRKAGIDFHSGDVLVCAGDKLHSLHGSVLAAANIDVVSVRRRPRVALFSNGDELREPGADLRPGQIINSNHFALEEMIKNWGGVPDYLGCAPDDEGAIEGFFKRAASADAIVPIGGASVGDYDYVKTAFEKAGGKTDFQKIAVKPGKPTWFGRIGEARVLGLPGNPASAIVCAALFLQPLVLRLLGQSIKSLASESAKLSTPLTANGNRESYLRAVATYNETRDCIVAPAPNQDSSLLSPFLTANALIRRKPNAPAVDLQDEVEIVRLS